MNPDRGPFSLLQVGDVPIGTSEISFISYESLVSVLINNKAVSLHSVEIPGVPFVDPRRFQVTADISEFAGKEVELKFVAGERGWFGLDNIAFLVVPEPSPWALATCGFAVILGGLIRCKR